MSRSRPATFVFIFIVVLLDVMALGIVIPVLPKLIEGFLGGDTARASQWVGIFTATWALMQFAFSPLIGAMSDHFGRRPIVLISCFALAFDYVLMALAPTLWWLLVGRIISGIASANAAAASAYIADVTPENERAAKFGLLGAAWGIGFVLGPALGGWLGEADLRLPFWAAAGLTLLNALYGLFVLPESLPPALRTRLDWRKANPFGAFQLISRYVGLRALASIALIYNIAHYLFPTVFALYTSYRYGWSPATLGLVLALSGVLSIIVQGVLVRPIVKSLGERRTLLLALLTGAFGFAWCGFAPTGSSFVAGMFVFAFMGLFMPALQGLMTRKVPATDQGKLQGFNTSVWGLAGLIGPPLFAWTFSTNLVAGAHSALLGGAFYVAAALMLIALLIAWLRAR